MTEILQQIEDLINIMNECCGIPKSKLEIHMSRDTLQHIDFDQALNMDEGTLQVMGVPIVINNRICLGKVFALEKRDKTLN